MKTIVVLDNLFFVIVKMFLRVTRMTSFIGANVCFGTTLVLMGFWILDFFTGEAPSKVVVFILWVGGGAIIFCTLLKGRDPSFAKKSIAELLEKYSTPWYSRSRRLIRVLTMCSTLIVLFFGSGTLLPVAFLFNGCTYYALAISFSEYEKKNNPS